MLDKNILFRLFEEVRKNYLEITEDGVFFWPIKGGIAIELLKQPSPYRQNNYCFPLNFNYIFLFKC